VDATVTPLGEIRLMQEKDVAQAVQLSGETGWNQTAEDWRTLLALAPEGCFCIGYDGQLAATASLICYGAQLAWLGMVLTRMEYRGRGLASTLVRECLHQADQRGIETVKLDATPKGQRIYEHFGFEPEQAAERWEAERIFADCSMCPPEMDWEIPAQRLDRCAFGANRLALLERIARQSKAVATENAFVFTRPGSMRRYLGPCVATDGKAARTVIEIALLRESGVSLFWDLLPANDECRNIAISLGFTMTRQLVRMRRGPAVQQADCFTFALAGFEFG
jgi:N-acetylglutamate synthase-like GNAT family acetyltransferase